jgi:hypothetical protein
MIHLPVRRQHLTHFTRRGVLKSAALGTNAPVAAPYVKGTYAAGQLSRCGNPRRCESRPPPLKSG